MKGKLIALLGKAKDWLLPLAKPIFKSIAIRYVQEEGDRFQAAIDKAIAQQGPTGARREIDRMLGAIEALIKRLPLVPERLKVSVCAEISEHGEGLKKKAIIALIEGGRPAFNLAFDAFQLAIIARIDAL